MASFAKGLSPLNSRAAGKAIEAIYTAQRRQGTAYASDSPDLFHFSWKTISSNGFRGGPDLPVSCG